MLNLGAEFPNFDVKTSIGQFNLHDYLENSWALICSHPADFTPVCTTEIARMAQLVKETEKRNVKVSFLSCDPVESHKEWVKDIEAYSGCKVPFPIIDDEDNKISAAVGMNEEGLDKFQTVRGVYVLDPSKKIRATTCYPTQVGRNFDEITRLIDALQLPASNNEVVTPAGSLPASINNMLNLGTEFPNFDVKTSIGQFNLHNHLEGSWALVCSLPADFTPVFKTEIAQMAQLVKETEKRNVKVSFLSCDPVESHMQWVKDIEADSGCKLPFPIINDENNKISAAVGMAEKGLDKFQPVRGVYVLDPSKKIRATTCYPTQVGRNFDEIIRLIDALQLTASNNEIVTPAGWKQGDEVLVKPGCEGTGARVEQLPSGKQYLRFQKC